MRELEHKREIERLW
jgi:hypothetical protein